MCLSMFSFILGCRILVTLLYSMQRSGAKKGCASLCIGGGIRTLDQIANIISLGVERVSICSAAIENNNFLLKAVDSVGGQSITVCLDLKFNYFTKRYSIYSHSGRKKNNIHYSLDQIEIDYDSHQPIEFSELMQSFRQQLLVYLEFGPLYSL